MDNSTQTETEEEESMEEESFQEQLLGVQRYNIEANFDLELSMEDIENTIQDLKSPVDTSSPLPCNIILNKNNSIVVIAF